MNPPRFHLPIALFAAVAVALSGCATVTLPGEITEKHSSYDGITRHTMAPAYLFSPEGGITSSSTMAIGLYYAGDKDWIFITAEVWGVALIQRMGIKIDGDTVELLPEGGAINTDVDISAPSHGETISRARFETTPDLIRRINRANNVIIRLHTSKGFVDGDFTQVCGKSAALAMTVCDGFAKFMSEIVDGNGKSE